MKNQFNIFHSYKDSMYEAAAKILNGNLYEAEGDEEEKDVEDNVDAEKDVETDEEETETPAMSKTIGKLTTKGFKFNNFSSDNSVAYLSKNFIVEVDNEGKIAFGPINDTPVAAFFKSMSESFSIDEGIELSKKEKSLYDKYIAAQEKTKDSFNRYYNNETGFATDKQYSDWVILSDLRDKAHDAWKRVSDTSEPIEEKKLSYSAKDAAAGKDIGKHGKTFQEIADKAAKKYGSKEAGERVAGAVLAKLRKEDAEDMNLGEDYIPSLGFKEAEKSIEMAYKYFAPTSNLAKGIIKKYGTEYTNDFEKMNKLIGDAISIWETVKYDIGIKINN